uniref:hypothetical protein n=1 Tax=Saccharothrix espanaensis TaxID=103731 RepID=UPI003F492EDB
MITSDSVTTDTDLDPRAAWAFAGTMTDLAELLIATLDTAHHDLVAASVTGAPLACIARMGDAARAFRADAVTAADHFRRHIDIQEQIEATPSMGGDATCAAIPPPVPHTPQ